MGSVHHWKPVLACLLLLGSLSVILPPPAAAKDAGQGSGSVAEFLIGYDPVGKPLQDFETITVTGRKVAAREVRGRVLLIDLWGISCWSCLEEMKALGPVYRDLSGKGLEVWAVNTDNMEAEEILGRLEKIGIQVSFPVLLDPDGRITGLFTSRFVPVTVIVDRNGIVRFYKVGFKESDMGIITETLLELLK